MPWFGMDIGGTLVKLVYFEPTDIPPEEEDASSLEIEIIRNIQKYLTDNSVYGETGHRDIHLQVNYFTFLALVLLFNGDSLLQMNGAKMGNRVGTLHFIRFPTSEMDQFLHLAKSKGFASLSSTICATGGGAYKFENDFLRVISYDARK